MQSAPAEGARTILVRSKLGLGLGLNFPSTESVCANDLWIQDPRHAIPPPPRWHSRSARSPTCGTDLKCQSYPLHQIMVAGWWSNVHQITNPWPNLDHPSFNQRQRCFFLLRTTTGGTNKPHGGAARRRSHSQRPDALIREPMGATRRGEDGGHQGRHGTVDHVAIDSFHDEAWHHSSDEQFVAHHCILLPLTTRAQA
jgi:hypothetical protein